MKTKVVSLSTSTPSSGSIMKANLYTTRLPWLAGLALRSLIPLPPRLPSLAVQPLPGECEGSNGCCLATKPVRTQVNCHEPRGDCSLQLILHEIALRPRGYQQAARPFGSHQTHHWFRPCRADQCERVARYASNQGSEGHGITDLHRGQSQAQLGRRRSQALPA